MENLVWIIPLAVILLVVMWWIGTYNGLVSRRNETKNSWSQIDVQLKRRYDLIPNLVEVAKGYMAHEKGTLEAVIAARNGASTAAQKAASNPADGEAIQGLMAAEAGLSGALGKLFALAEAYPDLKANENMLSLQEELTSTENKVGFARQGYNDSVTEYNTARESFPDVIFAGFFQFKAAELLQATESAEERQAVKVKF